MRCINKKTLMLIFINISILFPSINWSQIIIEQTDLQKIGFQAAFLADTTENVIVDVGNPGGPQNWNFSQALQGKILPYSVLDPVVTPYAAHFPQSNQTVLSMQHFKMSIPGFFNVDTLVPMYSYNQITPTQLNFLGNAITTSIYSGVFPLDQPTTLQPVPLTYGSSWQTVNHMEALLDTTYQSIPIQAIITWNDTSDIIVDAFGSLTIPTGNFDVLREKIIYTQHISIDISFGGIPLGTIAQQIQRLIYSWKTNNNGAILQVTSADTVFPFDENFTNALEVIRFMDTVSTNFNVSVQPNEVAIYPGDSVSCSVSLTPRNQFKGVAQLSIAPFVPGLSAEFIPEVIDSNTLSILTLHTSPSIRPDVYKLIISGTSGGEIDSDTLTLEIMEFPYVFIAPSGDSVQFAGNEFWLDIFIGDSLRSVNCFYGTSFVLRYDTAWAEIPLPLDSSIVNGGFLGSDDSVWVFHTPEGMLQGDSIGLSITRIAPGKGKSGYGKLLRIKFKIRSETPDSTQLCFSIASVEANDPDLKPIRLEPEDFCLTVMSNRITVWPGDTDNNGFVDQADVLPIGICWNETGYPRTGYANLVNWEPQYCHQWTQGEHYTYADANGDSVVGQNDILVLDLNWHKKRGLSKSCSEPLILSSTGTFKPVILEDSADFVQIGCEVEGVENLLGVGFEMDYASSKIDVVSVTKGDFLGEEALLFHHNEPDDEKLGIAVTRYGEQGTVSGKGCVTRIRMKLKAETDLSAIDFNHVTGMDSQGNQFEFEKKPLDLTSHLSENRAYPESYVLYQNYPNPFNSSTRIRYSIPESGHVEVKIYNTLGHEVAILVQEFQERGDYSCEWDGKDESQQILSSGIYFCRMKSYHIKKIVKVIFAR